MLNTVSLKFTCNSGVLVLLLAQAYFKKYAPLFYLVSAIQVKLGSPVKG